MKNVKIIDFKKIVSSLNEAAKPLMFGTIAYKILYGLIPFFYVAVYAAFLDKIILYFQGGVMLTEILPNIVWVALLSVFQYCGSNLYSMLTFRINLLVSKNEKKKFLKKCATVKYELSEQVDFQNLMYRVSSGLPNKITAGFYSMLSCIELLIKILSIIFIIGRYSLISSVFVCLCFFPIVYSSIKAGKQDYSAYAKYQETERRLNSYEDMISKEEYLNEMKIFGYKDFIMGKWSKAYEHSSDLFMQAKKKSYTYINKISGVIKFVFWIIIGIISYLAYSKDISIGICTSLIAQILTLSNSMTWSLSSYLYGITDSKIFLEDYNKFYNSEDVSEKTVTANSIEKIEFVDITFKYPDSDKYILKNLNMTLMSDETYALVGENGAGKTTIMKLLLGFYDDYQGKILINDVDIRKISNLREIFSVMFQDFAKYEISLKENLSFDEDIVDMNCIIDQMKLLDLHIENLENGLDTEVGKLADSNVNFSLGQWQKLAMIRASVHRGKFFILDEPTASLDPSAEASVYKNFQKLISNKAALIITHRLGAAKLADKILLIKDGKIHASGSHDDLLSNSEIYREMYENQKGWYVDNE